MKTEVEIRERLTFWQNFILAGQIGLMANHAELLLKLPESYQQYALGQLQYPAELRQHFAYLTEKSLGVITDTLKWVLDEK